jgi:meso-butanediol dehydrogenase/(S,S)-butanediol dehydrogenase/diacetyl reductase
MAMRFPSFVRAPANLKQPASIPRGRAYERPVLADEPAGGQNETRSILGRRGRRRSAPGSPEAHVDLANPFQDPSLGRRYRGKAALVTGAASGIGRATAIRLAAEGASVWCADVNEEGLNKTTAFIEEQLATNGAGDRDDEGGGAVRGGALDVTDPEQCHRVVDDAVAAFGRLDVLCNIAGVGGSAHTLEESFERFQLMMAVNAAGPFLLCQAALPVLIERKGNIVNLASTAGIIGQAYCAAYCASKHAVVGLTRALAIEYGRTGVRVNAVCPGGVNTNIIAGFTPPEGASMSLVSRSFLNRDLQEPESVAAMVAYVGSDEAYYVNGAVLAVDGGTTTG